VTSALKSSPSTTRMSAASASALAPAPAPASAPAVCGGSSGGGESVEDAFLLAGAQSVVLPLWNSPQASLPNTLLLMHFYSRLPSYARHGEPFPVAKTLQESQQWLRASSVATLLTFLRSHGHSNVSGGGSKDGKNAQKSLARQLHLWRLKHLCGENTDGNDDGLKRKGGWNYNGKNSGGGGDNAEDNETQTHLLGMDEIPFKSPRWWASFRAVGACTGTHSASAPAAPPLAPTPILSTSSSSSASSSISSSDALANEVANNAAAAGGGGGEDNVDDENDDSSAENEDDNEEDKGEQGDKSGGGNAMKKFGRAVARSGVRKYEAAREAQKKKTQAAAEAMEKALDLKSAVMEAEFKAYLEERGELEAGETVDEVMEKWLALRAASEAHAAQVAQHTEEANKKRLQRIEVQDQRARRRQQAAQAEAEEVASREKSGEADRERAEAKKAEVAAEKEEKVAASEAFTHSLIASEVEKLKERKKQNGTDRAKGAEEVEVGEGEEEAAAADGIGETLGLSLKSNASDSAAAAAAAAALSSAAEEDEPEADMWSRMEAEEHQRMGAIDVTMIPLDERVRLQKEAAEKAAKLFDGSSSDGAGGGEGAGGGGKDEKDKKNRNKGGWPWRKK